MKQCPKKDCTSDMCEHLKPHEEKRTCGHGCHHGGDPCVEVTYCIEARLDPAATAGLPIKMDGFEKPVGTVLSVTKEGIAEIQITDPDAMAAILTSLKPPEVSTCFFGERKDGKVVNVAPNHVLVFKPEDKKGE